MFNIEAIFAVPNTDGCLATVRFREETYEHEDEFELDKMMRQWRDPVYLYDFFCLHEADLQSGFYGASMTAHRAAAATSTEVDAFLKSLIEAVNQAANEKNYVMLHTLFETLDPVPRYDKAVEHKAKGPKRNSWLRIYAVKTDDDAYIITGAAIKLTGPMQERTHTQRELDKLRATARYLREALGKPEGFFKIYEFLV